jgi:hypothetical protein
VRLPRFGDEAQLETPRTFENAIQLFRTRIQPALERAHIFVTSREDAWRALPNPNSFSNISPLDIQKGTISLPVDGGFAIS